jgi:pyruvate formate lyase activating enzyme
VTAYHPDNKLTEPSTPVSTLDRAREIGLSSGLRYVYVGNIPGHPAQDTICPGCDSVLIDRQGFGIGANNVVRGSCRFCGYRLGVYRGPDVPLHSNTRGRPIRVL